MSEFYDNGSAFQFQIPDSSEPGNPDDTHPVIAPHFRKESFFADFEKWVRNLYRCHAWHKCVNVDKVDNKHAHDLQLTVAGGDAIDSPNLVAGSNITLTPSGSDITIAAAGSGDVSMTDENDTDNALMRADGTSGKLIQKSGILVDDSDNMSGVVSIDANTIELGGQAGNTDTTITRAGAGLAAVEGDSVVVAPDAIADNRLVRGHGGVNKVQESGAALDDSDNLSGVTSIVIDGADAAKLVELANDATHGERTYIGEVVTSNASSTTLLEFARPSASATIAVEYVITAVNRDDTTQRYIQKAVIEYYDNAGTLTVNGTPIEDHNNDTLTITGVSPGVNGSNIQIKVMGNASKTILWGIVARASWRNTSA